MVMIYGILTTHLLRSILPALLRIREDKGGSPFVDDQDVPEEIRSTRTIKENDWDIDEFHFMIDGHLLLVK